MGAQTSTQADSQVKDIFQKSNCETDEYIQSLYKGENLAGCYDLYRPHYPRKIYDEIMSYHNEVLTNGHQLAVDVCCGTGLSTLPLVPMFDKVVGVDVSQDLMEYMPKDIPNLTTHICPAENMTMIDSGTVDLVTIATGLHWVNIEKFLPEAKRILKPGQFYSEFILKFKDFMTSKPLIAYGKYETVEFPFVELRRFEMEVCDDMTIDRFKCYLSSIHFVSMYNEANLGTDEMET